MKVVSLGHFLKRNIYKEKPKQRLSIGAYSTKGQRKQTSLSQQRLNRRPVVPKRKCRWRKTGGHTVTQRQEEGIQK